MGASAVLANNVGRLIMRVNARNSICPGRMNARPMLKLEILLVIKKIIKKIKLP